jgi:hypothetical protein
MPEEPFTHEEPGRGVIRLLFSAALPCAFGIPVLWFSIEIMMQYGSALFIANPFVCGALAALLYNFNFPAPRLRASMGVALLCGGLMISSLLISGLEGLGCIVMAVPMGLPMFALGGCAGHYLGWPTHGRVSAGTTVIALLAVSPLLMGAEYLQGAPAQERMVRTEVIVEGNAEAVWQEVIAFSPIPPPEEFLFRAGIAYPIDAEIQGEGVGAIRHCNFSTGSFVEPITAWEPPHRLAFDVTEQPDPMTEWSPYGDIHPPHLDWALRSSRGEFLIQQLDDGRTALIGTTWYTVHLTPELYWGTVSDAIIHRIHKRVLEHIRSQVEAAPKV